MGLGLAALIGQILGAEKPERAKKTAYQAIGVALVITSIIALITILFAEPIMKLFFDPSQGHSETEVVAIGSRLLRILAISLPMVGVYIIMEMAFSGAGDNLPPMIFGIITGWVLEIPMIYIALNVLNMGPIGIWWSLTISSIIGISLFFWWFTKGHWLEKRVKGD